MKRLNLGPKVRFAVHLPQVALHKITHHQRIIKVSGYHILIHDARARDKRDKKARKSAQKTT
jgi:hypothetical protein